MDDIDPVSREASALDRRISVQAYCRILLCKCMSEMFYCGDQGSVTETALRRLPGEIRKMMLYPERTTLLISEIADGVLPVKSITEKIADDLRSAGKRIEDNFWNKIIQVPAAYRRSIGRPQRVSFMELDCYFVPVLALNVKSEIWILESTAVKESAELVACLHRMWVANELGRDPTAVRSLHLDEDYDLKQLDDLPSVSAALDGIRSDIHDMISAEMDGFITYRDFPPSPGNVCISCQFRNFCAKKGIFDAQS